MLAGAFVDDIWRHALLLCTATIILCGFHFLAFTTCRLLAHLAGLSLAGFFRDSEGFRGAFGADQRLLLALGALWTAAFALVHGLLGDAVFDGAAALPLRLLLLAFAARLCLVLPVVAAANRVASLLLEASLLAALGAHPRFGCALLALGAALLALVLGRRNGLALSYVTAALSSGLLLPRTRVAVRRLVLGKIRAYAWTALPNRTATIRPLLRHESAVWLLGLWVFADWWFVLVEAFGFAVDEDAPVALAVALLVHVHQQRLLFWLARRNGTDRCAFSFAFRFIYPLVDVEFMFLYFLQRDFIRFQFVFFSCV